MTHSKGTAAISAEIWVVTPSIRLDGTNAYATHTSRSRSEIGSGSGRGTFLWPLLDALPQLRRSQGVRPRVSDGDLAGVAHLPVDVHPAGQRAEPRAFASITPLEIAAPRSDHGDDLRCRQLLALVAVTRRRRARDRKDRRQRERATDRAGGETPAYHTRSITRPEADNGFAISR